MRYLITVFLAFLIFGHVCAQDKRESQDQNKKEKEAPAITLLRSEENYDYLKDKEANPYADDVFDTIKFIPLNKKKDIYLTFGGEIRSRIEYFENRGWEPDADETFYSQRLSVHGNLKVGKHLRFFGEFYSGYSSLRKEFAEYDELNVHQGFVEIKIPLKEKQSVSLRLGRQEMSFGATRLVGIREGPNIRRSFDAGRIIYRNGDTTVQAFYGKEVRPDFKVFDNEFTLFDGDAKNPKLWGLYSQFNIKGDLGKTELYYFGFQSKNSRFNDVSGKETRHTLGVRRLGSVGKRFRYNTEFMYQFGTIGDQDITAFNVETDWHYQLVEKKWKPDFGVKLDWSSGDDQLGDNKINTFNPMFVNPAYYSLALTVTPVNMISIHPSITLAPTEKLSLYTEWGIFFRESKNDALYRPPRFIGQGANGNRDRGIGNQMGFKFGYEFNRHFSFDLDMSYFVAGKFLKETGEAENIFHIAPTLSFKF